MTKIDTIETVIFQKGYTKENGQCTIGENVYSKIYCGYKCIISVVGEKKIRSKVLLPTELSSQDEIIRIQRAFDRVSADEQDIWRKIWRLHAIC